MAITVRHSYSASDGAMDISSVVVDSGSGRVLLFVVDAYPAIANLPTAVTYGGVSLTSFTSFNWLAAPAYWLQGWYLLDPAVGTANISCTGTGPGGYRFAMCSTIDGVDTSSAANAFGTRATNSGNDANPTLDVSSGSGQLVFGLVTAFNRTITISATSSELSSAADLNEPIRGKTLQNSTGGTTQTVAATLSSGNYWGMWGVSLKPSGGSTPSLFRQSLLAGLGSGGSFFQNPLG